MNWNFRLVDISHENDNEPCIALREVYYDDDGAILGYCEPCTVADNLEGITWLLKTYQEAFNAPVLNGKEIVGSEDLETKH